MGAIEYVFEVEYEARVSRRLKVRAGNHADAIELAAQLIKDDADAIVQFPEFVDDCGFTARWVQQPDPEEVKRLPSQKLYTKERGPK